MKRSALFGIIVIIVVVLAVAAKMGGKPKEKPKPADAGISVQVGLARTGDMAETIAVSGSIKALNAVQLSAKMSGRVVSVAFREGDTVGAGRTVVQQDTSDLRAQVRQAEAGLQAARARLSQAMTSESVSDTTTEAQIASAQAALDAAKARFNLVKSGARTQEKAQAENAVTMAKASYDNAKSNRDRMRALFLEGALSPQQMDQAQTQFEVASAQYESAKQQLSLVQEGARVEEIEATRKQVEQAEEGLRIARTGRESQKLRAEDIKAARAGVAQAQAALAYARQQLANASITTPIAGTVSKRLTEPGQMASPGVPLIELVALNTVYFDATVSEMEMHKIKIGQPVKVNIDALPGETFMGSVLKILPTAEQSSRQFHVWIAVPNKGGALKPGMFARGSIQISVHKDTVIVPKDALITDGNGSSDHTVYTISESKARLKTVKIGFQTREEAEVLSGISAGDELVVGGQDRLSDGVKVNVAD